MFRLDPIFLMPIDFIVLFTSSSHVSATWRKYISEDLQKLCENKPQALYA